MAVKKKYTVNSLLQKCYGKGEITQVQMNIFAEIFHYTKPARVKSFLSKSIDTNEVIEWYLLMKSILLDIEIYPLKLHKELANEIIIIWLETKKTKGGHIYANNKNRVGKT